MRIGLFFIIWVLSFQITFAQTCSGNLGENIFTNGDFGSGVSTVLQTDPKIAPGYSYTTNVPPYDGAYVIASTTDWPTAYPTWLRIKDRSGDPNGYMMIVNASFSAGIFYEQTISGLCENTLYEFSADVINVVRTITLFHTLPNISFLLNDSVFFNTGGIAQSEQWNNYGFTFTTKGGQTSLKLSLRNNAPGGNGNDLAIDNISFRACGPQALILPETIANICEDGSPIEMNATINGSQFANPALQWQVSPDGISGWTNLGKDLLQKHNRLKSGFYYYRYLLAASDANLLNSKCRLVSNVKIIYVQPKLFAIYDTICAGNRYVFGGKTIFQSGVYIDSLLSSLGCDSIVTLYLEVVPDMTMSADKIIEIPTCTGYKDGLIRIQSIQSGYAPYKVFVAGRTSMDNTFGLLGRGKYPLLITDRFGCRLSDTLTVDDPPLFSVSIDSSRTIKLGQSVSLIAKGSMPIRSGQYQFNKGVICSIACEGTSYLPLESGKLFFSARSDAGCMAADSAVIKVDDNAGIFVPNVFTPNGDGINDVLIPYTATNVIKAISLFSVYDRYGGLVYEAANVSPKVTDIGWDGNWHSRPAPQGIYAFRVQVILINDRVISKKGDVLLLH